MFEPDDPERLFLLKPGRTEFDKSDSEWEVPEGLENLFEKGEAHEIESTLVTRSQPAAGMAADSGQPAVGMARSVGRAAALTPVTRIENTDNFRKAAKPRGSCEAQVPFSTAVLSAQQLNSKRQNLRRSKLRAEEKAAATLRGNV